MKVVSLIAAAVVVFAIASLIFMWMWNYAVVAAMSFANPISYGVAACLMVFISLFVVSGRQK